MERSGSPRAALAEGREAVVGAVVGKRLAGVLADDADTVPR